MARQTLNLRRFFSAIKTIAFASVILSVATSTRAQSENSPEVRDHQTHRSFADSCLRELSEHILTGFTPNRTSPLAVISDSLGDPNGTLAAGITGILSERGLLIREDTGAISDDGNWSLRYSLSPIQLTLSEPQRRELLGKIWVKRTLRAEIDMTVQDNTQGDVVWAGSADSTYSDWIPKGAIKSLESADLAPKAPATGWEKAKIPIIVGGGALLVGAFMLAMN